MKNAQSLQTTGWYLQAGKFLFILLFLMLYLAISLLAGSWAPDVTDWPIVNKILVVQVMGVALAMGMIAFCTWLYPASAQYLSWGTWGNAAQPDKVLGIGHHTHWWRVVLTSGLAITSGTALFMVMGLGAGFSWSLFWVLWPMVLLFSASNAFIEEILARFSVVSLFGVSVRGNLSARGMQVCSAILFGGVHYWGAPGGPVGVVMAAYLAYFLTKAMIETRGMGIPWSIHFLQDVIIFSLLLCQESK